MSPLPQRALRLTAGAILLVTLGACGGSSAQTDVTHAQPQPCTFLTQGLAAHLSGDASVTNQGSNVTEPVSGFVACIFANPRNEADNAAVQMKRESGDIARTTLQTTATFFSRGEPVQPFQPFTVNGIGDNALGESTPGVAFIVFSKSDVLVYVGAGSASLSVAALQRGVIDLARPIASAV
jgi:hypothetical protein